MRVGWRSLVAMLAVSVAVVLAINEGSGALASIAEPDATDAPNAAVEAAEGDAAAPDKPARVISSGQVAAGGLKLRAEVVPELFRLGENPKVHVYLTADPAFRSQADTVRITAVLRGVGSMLERTRESSRTMPLDKGLKTRVHHIAIERVLHIPPAEKEKMPFAARILVSLLNRTLAPGPADLTVRVVTKRTLANGHREPVDTLETWPLRVTLLPKRRTEPASAGQGK